MTTLFIYTMENHHDYETEESQWFTELGSQNPTISSLDKFLEEVEAIRSGESWLHNPLEGITVAAYQNGLEFDVKSFWLAIMGGGGIVGYGMYGDNVGKSFKVRDDNWNRSEIVITITGESVEYGIVYLNYTYDSLSADGTIQPFEGKKMFQELMARKV
jgi:hypothetical protein